MSTKRDRFSFCYLTLLFGFEWNIYETYRVLIFMVIDCYFSYHLISGNFKMINSNYFVFVCHYFYFELIAD